MISSVIPSLKYSLSASALMLANGSTAIDLSVESGSGDFERRDSISSAPVRNLFAGSRSRSLETARLIDPGTDGRKVTTAGAFVVNLCAMTEFVVGPVNGTFPVSISNIVQPSEYRSLRPSSSSSPDACSGDM